MTRLVSGDIKGISAGLPAYDQRLVFRTGMGLLGIACHGHGVSDVSMREQMASFTVHVVPVTAGQGIISQFSATVAAILNFLGIQARVSPQTDNAGIDLACKEGVDGILMADDHQFVGLNLRNRKVVGNSEETGRVFAAALGLMAGGISAEEFLVVGCGPVGEAAAKRLMSEGGRITLFDIDPAASERLHKRLSPVGQVCIAGSIDEALAHHSLILDASPAANAIPDRLLDANMRIAAPGVPSGISDMGIEYLQERVIHDKLELGVAGMAVGLLIESASRE